MSARMPVVFVSHGAPDALLHAPETVACWRRLGQQMPKPAAILVISAHWEARKPTVSLSGAPVTLHDFSGFSPTLYHMQYPAPGAPALAERVATLLSAADIASDLHPGRGLDHGAWVPLSVMYPQADIPVVQLSLDRTASTVSHAAIGHALAALRDEGVLIIASGAITHNFGWLDRQTENATTPLPQAKIFTDWIADRLEAHDETALLTYRTAPYGAEAHPSEEHILPLFVALGAADGDKSKRCCPYFTYGSLAMDAYMWGAAAQA